MASINLNSNYTRIMKTGSIITETLTDGFATLSGGTLSNLYDPVNDSDCATKYYVDNYIDTTNVSLPLNSIQINTGTNFIGVSSLTFANNTMYVYNKINNGSIAITDNNINGVSMPIQEDGIGTYDYFVSTNLSMVNYSTTNQSNSLTTGQVINVFLNRTITNTSDIVQDILPTDTSIISAINGITSTNTSIASGNTSGTTSSYSFKFVYYLNGSSTSEKVLLFGNIITYGNFLYVNDPLPVITIPKNTLVYFDATYNDGTITYYLKNNQNLYSEPQILDKGLLTNNWTSYSNDLNAKLNSTFIIWPLVPTEIDSDTSYTYTYNNIKNKLIIRTGLTTDTTDTFDELTLFASTSSGFALGSGQIKFTVQNISDFNLKIGPDSPPTGWSYDTNFNRTIPPDKNGFFYINYTGSTLYLYTIGIYNRNG